MGPFQIAAAPRADGAMARTMASIGASAGTTARAYGRTAGDLDGSLASLPIQLWGAASAASALQSQTGSPLDPGRTIHGEPVDLATADALAALFGFEAAAAAYAAQTAALGAPPDPVTTTPIVASGDPPTPARGPHAPEAPPIVIERVEFTTAANLSYYMRRAEVNRAVLQNEILTAFSNAADHIGNVPHAAAQVASISASATLYALTESIFIEAALLPSSLINARATFSRSSFEEDYTERGTWSDYTVWATSKTWNPNGSLFRGAAELAFGARGLNGLSAAAGPNMNAAMREMGAAYAEMHASNAAKSAAQEAGRQIGTGVGPYEWGPIDITDITYSTAETTSLNGGVAVGIDLTARQYWPLALGRGFVQLLPVRGMFPPEANRIAAQLTHAHETDPIVVTLSPAARVVDPGTSLRVSAAVQNAVDTRLRWNLTPEASGVRMSPDADTQRATLAFPNRENVRVTLTATSRARTGLRDPAIATDRRDAEGTYGTSEEEDIDLPSGSCAFTVSLVGETLDVRDAATNETAEPTVALASATRTGSQITSLELAAAPMSNGDFDYSAADRLSLTLSLAEPEFPGLPASSGGIPAGATGTFPIWISVYVPAEMSPSGEQLDVNSTDLEQQSLTSREHAPGTLTITESTEDAIGGVIEADMAWLDLSGLEEAASGQGESWDEREARIEEDVRTQGQTDRVRNMLFATGRLRVAFRAVVSEHEGIGAFMCLGPLAERGELSETLMSQLRQVSRALQGR
ncbi:MAG: hypothetical protein AAF845_11620 [Bacteroidota bacterium]